MRYLLSLFLLTVCSVYGQKNLGNVKQLEDLKKNIQFQILILNDSILKIDFQINAIKFQNISKSISDSTITAFVKKGAKLKKSPDVLAELVTTLTEDKKVIILDYQNEFFGVCADSICGYMNQLWINKTPEIREFVQLKENEQKELDRINSERKIKKEESENADLEKKYIKKYGNETYKKLKNKYVWIGMTQEMATISLGSPDSVNRSVGSWGVHEQWVYKRIYLYFENGKLSSYQD